MKHRIAASTMTVLTLAGGALGVAAVSAVPASAATCTTMTVSDSGALGALVISISPASVTVKKGGCVDFAIDTSHSTTVSVDGSAVGSEWAAASVGPHLVSATESGGLLLKVSKLGAGTVTVTPPPTPPPVPSPNPSNPTGGGGNGGGSGGGTGGGSGGGTGGGSGGHAGGGSGGGAGGHSGGHQGGGLLGSGGHRGSGVGQTGTGGLLSGGSGFSLPSIPLSTFSREGLAGMTDGTTPQLAPRIGGTDAAGNPLPLVSGGTQQLSLASDSRSSGGRSPLPPIVAGLLILATGLGLVRATAGRGAASRGAVDGRHALRVHRA